MVELQGRERVEATRLLYDKDVLDEYVEQYETPLGIKMNVRTSAKQYEIRTAIRYWFGGSTDHRTSERIWHRCRHVDEGHLTLVGSQLKRTEMINT